MGQLRGIFSMRWESFNASNVVWDQSLPEAWRLLKEPQHRCLSHQSPTNGSHWNYRFKILKYVWLWCLGLMPAKDGAEEPLVGVPKPTRGCISSPEPVCSGFWPVFTDLFVFLSSFLFLFLDLHTTQIATSKATTMNPPINQNSEGTATPTSSTAMVSPALHLTAAADALLVAGIAWKHVYPSTVATHSIGVFHTSKTPEWHQAPYCNSLVSI